MTQRNTPENFWSKVDKSGGPGNCWPWTASRHFKGYGTVGWHGKVRKAHRVAFMLTTGEWPTSLACHSCDNPPCCNPAHLFDGTNDENMKDMARKERCNRKLTGDEVRTIRAVQGRTQQNIADEYGICHTTVSKIRRMECRLEV